MANRESQYLKASEVAARLDLDISTVYKLCAEKVIPSIKVGAKAVRIPRAAFDAYLARQESGGDRSRPLLEEARQARQVEVGREAIETVGRQNQSFRERTGFSAYEFAEQWKKGRIEDSSENASLLIEALSIREALTRAGVGDRILV